ncbi:MAG: TonB-dependent receptor plug domain-containing protein, partial [Bacteroidota bacterium]
MRLFHRISVRSLLTTALLLASPILLLAQITVTGTILDADNGEPLIGASVLLRGTSTGTVADLDGSFSITVPDESAVLVFSYTGFQGQEVTVGGQRSFDIKLAAGESLQEVIVVGYGSKKKMDVVGAISSLTPKDFEKQPVTQVTDVLQGRTAGVQVVNSSGSPGNNAKIRIRGTNSLTGSSNPLIVVDGVIGASLGALNPGDIQSMQVLKDASATAMYGSRG